MDGFPAARSCIINEEECLSLLDGPADRAAKLVLPQRIRHLVSRDGQDPLLQEVMRVESAVLYVIVKRTVQVVSAGFGDDVDDAAQGAALLGPEAVIDHAKFADRFLGRRAALGAGSAVDGVRAVHGDEVAEVAHASEGDARNLRFSKRGLETGAPGGDARGQQDESSKQPSTDRQRLNLVGADTPANLLPG